MNEKWFLQTKKADFNGIAKKYNISPITARLMRNRDVISEKEINQYLNGTINEISSPWLFKDMDKATYSFYPLHNSAEFYLYPAIAFHQKQKCPQHIHHLTL